jgi:hypothetical protein
MMVRRELILDLYVCDSGTWGMHISNYWYTLCLLHDQVLDANWLFAAHNSDNLYW